MKKSMRTLLLSISCAVMFVSSSQAEPRLTTFYQSVTKMTQEGKLGQVIKIQAKNLKLQVMDVHQLTMALPESPDFLKADLSGDPAAAQKKG